MNKDEYKYFLACTSNYDKEFNMNEFIVNNEERINKYYDNKLFNIRQKTIKINSTFIFILVDILHQYLIRQAKIIGCSDVKFIIKIDQRFHLFNLVENCLISISKDMKYIKASVVIDNVIFMTCYDLQNDETPERKKYINKLKIIDPAINYTPYIYDNNKKEILHYKNILLKKKRNLIKKKLSIPEYLINVNE